MNANKYCKYLRTKKMYIPALAEHAFADTEYEAAHSSHCWCNCTLKEAGPDDRPVGPKVCDSSRTCFQE